MLRELYPSSIVYLDARGVRELLAYIGKKQTEELTGQLKLLCDLFIPADYDVHLFWDMHFGINDVDAKPRFSARQVIRIRYKRYS